MIAGFTLLLAKIVALAQWLGALVVKVFVALWDWIRDAFTWPFEQLMSLAVSALGALDLQGVSLSASGLTIPSEIADLLGLLGVGTAMAIIASAIGIRLLLQLIPFTRLGS